MLGTNPWFKKPRAIGEKVDDLGTVLLVGSGEEFEPGLQEAAVNGKSGHSLSLRSGLKRLMTGILTTGSVEHAFGIIEASVVPWKRVQ